MKIRIRKHYRKNTNDLSPDTRRNIATAKKEKSKKPLARKKWIKDVRYDGNLFLLAFSLELLENLCNCFKGNLSDNDAFSPIAKLMSWEKLQEIFTECTTKKVRKEMQRPEYDRIRIPEEEGPKTLLMALWLHPKSNSKFRKSLLLWLAFSRKKVNSWLKKQPDPTKKRFDELRRLFDLTDCEYNILVATAAIEIGILPCNDFRGKPTSKKASRFSALLNIKEHEYLESIRSRSKLQRYGCLDSEGDLNNDLMPFITGIDDTPLSNRYFKKSEEDVLPWNYFGSLSEQNGTFLKMLIASRPKENSMNILLYGEPGTGKTSFALALAKELKLTPYLIGHSDEFNNRGKNLRFSALQVCDRQIDPKHSCIIIDEADAMLEDSGCSEGGITGTLIRPSEQTGGKGLLNNTLDTVKSPCIWITNSKADALDKSNRRRFDYSIEFSKLTCQQREKIWKNAVRKHSLEKTLSSQALTQLAAKYEVSAGGISLAVRNLSAIQKSGTLKQGEEVTIIESLLKPHCQLLGINNNNNKPLVSSDYSLDGLNIKGPTKLSHITKAIRRFRVEQENESMQTGNDTPRMNLLLSGPPGTGKTEFVKYLGSSLNTRVNTHMGSNLLSMWVGGTEKNIKKAFEEAASEKSILFLDEVDGLVQSRERASASWQVTQVNELLHQMENFNGVLVCATNFIKNLDPATIRRFTFKLEFDYLTDEGKRMFFTRMFNTINMGKLSPTSIQRLNKIDALTPGDFRTVRQGLYYLDSSVNADLILDNLEQESLAKSQGVLKGTIGF